jgi:type II secretory pathway predicted ATPase ExeA/septal ring-binding cell division protein DamX
MLRIYQQPENNERRDHTLMSLNDTEKEQQHSNPSPLQRKSGPFFSGGGRGEILADMRKALAEDVPILVLTGDAGSGKTMMCEMISANAPSGCISVVFSETVDSFEDVVRAVGREVGLKAEVLASAKVPYLLQEMRLVLSTGNTRLFILFDQAERIFLATLERIRKMLDLLNEQGVTVQILFSGTSLLLSNLRQLRIVNFREAVEKKYLLEPLSLTETSVYLKHALTHHPRQIAENVFPKAIIATIYAEASGNFGKTKDLAEEALNSLDQDASSWVLLENIQEKEKRKPFAALKKWAPFGKCLAWKWPLSWQWLRSRKWSFSWNWLPRLSMPRLSINWNRISPWQWLRSREWSLSWGWLPRIPPLPRMSMRTLKIAGVVICGGAIVFLLWPGKETDLLVTQDKTENGSVGLHETSEKQEAVIAEKNVKAETVDSLEQRATVTDEKSATTTQQPEKNQPSVAAEVQEVRQDVVKKKEEAAVISRADTKNSGNSPSPTTAQQETVGATGIPSATGSASVVKADVPGKQMHSQDESAHKVEISQQVREIAQRVQGEKDRIDKLLTETNTVKDQQQEHAVFKAGSADTRKAAQSVMPEVASIEKITAHKKKVVVPQTRLAVPKKNKLSMNEQVAVVDTQSKTVRDDTVDLLYKKRLAAGEQWTSQQKNNRYTVQLMSLNSDNAEEKVKEMLAQDGFKDNADKLTIVKKNNSPNSIVVFYGDYATMTDARNARNTIPSALRKHNPYAISVNGALRKINSN